MKGGGDLLNVGILAQSKLSLLAIINDSNF